MFTRKFSSMYQFLIVILCYDLGKINMICMSAFFRLSGVLPIDEAMTFLRESITKTYSNKGEDVVKKNLELLEGVFTRCVQFNISQNVAQLLFIFAFFSVLRSQLLDRHRHSK